MQNQITLYKSMAYNAMIKPRTETLVVDKSTVVFRVVLPRLSRTNLRKLS